MARRIIEVVSRGIDEALAGITSDPYGATPISDGLRIPQNSGTSLDGARYLFLLASMQIPNGWSARVKGFRQLVKIGVNAVNTGAPDAPLNRPFEMEQTTPDFRFPDGNISWHLVREPNLRNVPQRPNTDSNNFSFQQSDTPALIYQTATFAAGFFNPITGAPQYYNVGLLTYTAPNLTQDWQDLGGYGNIHSVISPWDSPLPIDIDCTGFGRVSLYASVLQTAGNNLTQPVLPDGFNVAAPGTPEEGLIQQWSEVDSGTGIIYWRVGGGITVEFDRLTPENLIPVDGSFGDEGLGS